MTDAPNRTGDTVKESADYRAVCCGVFKKLADDELFPRCSMHGDTEWERIPPFDAIKGLGQQGQPPLW